MNRVILLAAAAAIGFAAPTSAKEPIRLANNPTLSPDGATVVFDWGGDIWSVPTAGGVARQLTTNPARDREPKFSPDGKQVAFISDREAAAQVWVIPSEGGAAKRLTYHTGGYAVQGWTGDGQRLLVSASRDHHYRRADRFFLISAKERSAEEILFDEYGANGSLSPDGSKLLFNREGLEWWRKGYHGTRASQVWLFDLAAKNYRKLLDDDRGNLWPQWKADGRGFYYVAGKSGSYNLWDYDLASGEQKQLTRFADDSVVQPCVSKDGSTVVFRYLFDLYRLRPGNGEPEKINIARDADRSEERKQRRALTTATAVAFANDGLEVAFTAGGDLWVMDTELREPKQVTTSAEEDKVPVFSPEGDSILFVSDSNGQTDLWRAERADKQKFWFQNTKFKLTQITTDGATKTRLTWSPDGSRVAFVKNRGELWVMTPDGKDAKKVISSFSDVQYDWSPDGKWFVAAYEDADFNRDVWVVSVDGGRQPYNLSRTPDNEGNPVWSPDGKLIAYTGRNYSAGGRGGAGGGGEPDGGAMGERDIHYVWVRTADDEISSRDRSVEKALEKINRVRQQSGRRGPAAAGKDTDEPKAGADAGTAEPRAQAGRRRPEITIDFDKLHERVKAIPLPGTAESNLFWSADGKKLLFNARMDNQAGTYSVDFPDELRPRLFSATTGTQARWLRSANQIVWLVNGVPGSLAVSAAGRPAAGAATTPAPTTPGGGRGGRGAARGGPGRGGATPPTTAPTGGDSGAAGSGATYAFQALQLVDMPAKNAAVFDLCWRTMRDNWYDERLNNRDWAKVREKYLEMARQAPDTETVTTVVQLMLGELNGSHLGFSAGGAGRRGAPPGAPAPGADEPTTGRWTETTAHLGVRFDSEFRGPGLKVRDVLQNGPADNAKSRIQPGELIVSIDGEAVHIGMDLTTVLNGPPGREFNLKVRAADGQERDVTLRPITYVAARTLLYEKWLADNRKSVDELSRGTLGYIYVRSMDMPSFQTFQRELYNAGAGKEGLVIDVRDNGGGSTADHLLTALTQPVHAITVPRNGTPGYPHDRKVYATWTKPIVVMCNQNSFSNAEIFSHAIKTLKRGKLVGVPTAGGVISTGAAQIMDVGTIRLPARGWYTLNDGEDMELHGAVPDYVVWPQPGDAKDAQVAKAVEVLLDDVRAWKARPQPPLKKASERK